MALLLNVIIGRCIKIGSLKIAFNTLLSSFRVNPRDLKMGSVVRTKSPIQQ